MKGEIQTAADVIQMHADDHVATALKDIKAGEKISYVFNGNRFHLEVIDDIMFGHKIALADIPAGTKVKKYGEVIGQASMEISAGQHVHVHNIEGLRGRGDQAGKGAKA
ncbi:UxaA family hydrolase [Neobacillus mesonae]|nr:UxaA family hydrolase [Neobacillus mesonae]